QQPRARRLLSGGGSREGRAIGDLQRHDDRAGGHDTHSTGAGDVGERERALFALTQGPGEGGALDTLGPVEVDLVFDTAGGGTGHHESAIDARGDGNEPGHPGLDGIPGRSGLAPRLAYGRGHATTGDIDADGDPLTPRYDLVQVHHGRATGRDDDPAEPVVALAAGFRVHDEGGDCVAGEGVHQVER